MNETQHILKNFAKDFKGQFLALGEWPDVTNDLAAAGWEGVVVDHRADGFSIADRDTSKPTIYIHGPVAMAPHYIEVEYNYKMRAVTLREMLETFPGPFDVLIVNVPGLGKDLSTCAEVWVSWPRVLCVRSEGREQEIVNLASAHSYKTVRIERDALVMARPEETKK